MVVKPSCGVFVSLALALVLGSLIAWAAGPAPSGETSDGWAAPTAEGAVAALEKTRIPAAEITATLDRLRSALGVSTGREARTPVRRQAVSVRAAAAGPRVSLPEAVRAASRLLLPGEVSQVLDRLRPKTMVVVPVLDLGTAPYPLLETSTGTPLLDRGAVVVAPGLQEALKWRSHERRPLRPAHAVTARRSGARSPSSRAHFPSRSQVSSERHGGRGLGHRIRRRASPQLNIR